MKANLSKKLKKIIKELGRIIHRKQVPLKMQYPCPCNPWDNSGSVVWGQAEYKDEHSSPWDDPEWKELFKDVKVEEEEERVIMAKATVKVYMKYGGATFSYDIEAPSEEELTSKAREHVAAISQNGYRHCSGGTLEWFPIHWIDKVKVQGFIQTSYPDRSGGT